MAATSKKQKDGKEKKPTRGALSLREQKAAKPAAKKDTPAKAVPANKKAAKKPVVKKAAPAAKKAPAKTAPEKKPITKPAQSAPKDVEAAAAVIGRPVEIPDKKRMTIDLTGELVKLCLNEIKASGDDGKKKKAISPFVRKVLIAHFEAKKIEVKNKC